MPPSSRCGCSTPNKLLNLGGYGIAPPLTGPRFENTDDYPIPAEDAITESPIAALAG